MKNLLCLVTAALTAVVPSTVDAADQLPTIEIVTVGPYAVGQTLTFEVSAPKKCKSVGVQVDVAALDTPLPVDPPTTWIGQRLAYFTDVTAPYAITLSGPSFWGALGYPTPVHAHAFVACAVSGPGGNATYLFDVTETFVIE